MANLKRVRCSWSGNGIDGPSVSTFFFTATATGFSAALQTFFQALKTSIPTGTVVSVPNTGDTISETTGVLQGVWTDSGGSTTTGTGSGVFQNGSGARIRWVTGGIHKGRRVVGTTFVVPMISLGFDSNGFVGAATTASLTTTAGALVSSMTPNFVVWSKPTSVAAADGASNVILSGFCPREATQLRSRRV